MISLDPLFARIPQPERSGTVGALLALLTLYTLVATGGNGVGAFCGILPWKCSVHAEEYVEPKSRDFHIQLISPGKGHGRVCMVEDEYILFTDISGHSLTQTRHYRSFFPAYFLESCDPEQTTNWDTRNAGDLKDFDQGYFIFAIPHPDSWAPEQIKNWRYDYRARFFWSDKVENRVEWLR